MVGWWHWHAIDNTRLRELADPESIAVAEGIRIRHCPTSPWNLLVSIFCAIQTRRAWLQPMQLRRTSQVAVELHTPQQLSNCMKTLTLGCRWFLLCSKIELKSWCRLCVMFIDCRPASQCWCMKMPCSSLFYRQESHECIVALLRCTTHLQGPLGTLKLRLQRLSECGKTLLLPTAANLQTGRDSLEDQQSWHASTGRLLQLLPHAATFLGQASLAPRKWCQFQVSYSDSRSSKYLKMLFLASAWH